MQNHAARRGALPEYTSRRGFLWRRAFGWLRRTASFAEQLYARSAKRAVFTITVYTGSEPIEPRLITVSAAKITVAKLSIYILVCFFISITFTTMSCIL